MERVYVFLIQNDVWIYILAGLAIFWYGSELYRARRALRRAVFGLEVERGRRLQSTSLTFLTVLLLLVGTVVYVNVQIRPGLPAELLLPPTPTPNIFRTPLASPTPLRDFLETPDASPTAPLVPTVTLSAGGAPQPVIEDGTPQPEITGTPDAPTVEPTLPAAVTAGCTPNINISSPANGSQVSGSVAFIGTANVPEFAFYKLEVNGPETNNQWASVLGQVISQPIVNGLLGSGNFGAWAAGRYDVRLTVVDATSNEVGQCLVQIDLGG